MNRYMISVYINHAKSILADIYASPKASYVSPLLTSADKHAAALNTYGAMDTG